MNRDIQNLIALQKIDSRIAELNNSKKEFPAQIEALQKLVTEAEAVVGSVEKKIVEIESERKSIEDKAELSRSALGKSEQRLNSISTNREYDAVHSEIESHKHIIVNSENRLKNFAPDTERLVAQKQEAQQALDSVRAENQPKIDELKEKVASVDADIAIVSKERDAIIPTLERQLLRTYEHILKRRKNGKVISLVNASDGICVVCHKILETQLIHEIRRALRVHICESCGSMLVWDFDAEPQGTEPHIIKTKPRTKVEEPETEPDVQE